MQTNGNVGFEVLISTVNIIDVYDENKKLVMEKKGLSKEAIKIIEKSFLDVVTKIEYKKKFENDNYMMYT